VSNRRGSDPAWFVIVSHAQLIAPGLRALLPVRPTGPVPGTDNELIVSGFDVARRWARAIRFEDRPSASREQVRLDHAPHLADGTYKLDGDQLTFSDARGSA
jgi:hypothetical protein